MIDFRGFHDSRFLGKSGRQSHPTAKVLRRPRQDPAFPAWIRTRPPRTNSNLWSCSRLWIGYAIRAVGRKSGGCPGKLWAPNLLQDSKNIHRYSELCSGTSLSDRPLPLEFRYASFATSKDAAPASECLRCRFLRRSAAPRTTLQESPARDFLPSPSAKAAFPQGDYFRLARLQRS